MRADDVMGRGVGALLALGAALYVSSTWFANPAMAVDLTWISPLDVLARSGNMGVSLVLVALGFGVSATLLLARARGLRALGMATLQTLGGLWAVQAVTLAGYAILGLVLDSRPGLAGHSEVVNRALTFRFNTYAADNLLVVPPELHALWVFSVAAQLVALIALGIALFGARPGVTAIGVGAVALGLQWWKADMVDAAGWFAAAWSTAYRADVFLIGSAAALLAARRPVGVVRGNALASAMSLALVGVVLAGAFVGPEVTLSRLVPVAALVAASVLLGLSSGVDERSLLPVLARRPGVVDVGVSWAWLVAPAAIVVELAAEIVDGAWGLVLAVAVILGAGFALVGSRTAAAVAAWLATPEGEPVASGAEVGDEDRGAGSVPSAHP